MTARIHTDSSIQFSIARFLITINCFQQIENLSFLNQLRQPLSPRSYEIKYLKNIIV